MERVCRVKVIAKLNCKSAASLNKGSRSEGMLPGKQLKYLVKEIFRYWA